MKKLLILCFFSINAYAQIETTIIYNKVVQINMTPKLMQTHEFKQLDLQFINEVTIKENLIGKKVVSTCDKTSINEICEAKLFKLFKLEADNKIRIIKYDSIVTMDYSSSRLNVLLNKEDKIIQITIG